MCHCPDTIRTLFALTGAGNRQTVTGAPHIGASIASREIESCDPTAMSWVFSHTVRERNAPEVW